MGYFGENQSDSLTVSGVFNDSRSRAIDFVNRYRAKLMEEQQAKSASHNAVQGSLTDRLAHYSNYTTDTSCARTNK